VAQDGVLAAREHCCKQATQLTRPLAERNDTGVESMQTTQRNAVRDRVVTDPGRHQLASRNNSVLRSSQLRDHEIRVR
jgi:hypothetical protein